MSTVMMGRWWWWDVDDDADADGEQWWHVHCTWQVEKLVFSRLLHQLSALAQTSAVAYACRLSLMESLDTKLPLVCMSVCTCGYYWFMLSAQRTIFRPVTGNACLLTLFSICAQTIQILKSFTSPHSPPLYFFQSPLNSQGHALSWRHWMNHRLNGSSSPVLTATCLSYGRLCDFLGFFFPEPTWRSHPSTDFDAK